LVGGWIGFRVERVGEGDVYYCVGRVHRGSGRI
jgi:hypothetical protein